MDRDRSGRLVVVAVRWQQKSGNGWLLREVFDLLLRDPGPHTARTGPDLTDRDTPLTMQLEVLTDEEGGET